MPSFKNIFGFGKKNADGEASREALPAGSASRDLPRERGAFGEAPHDELGAADIPSEDMPAESASADISLPESGRPEEIPLETGFPQEAFLSESEFDKEIKKRPFSRVSSGLNKIPVKTYAVILVFMLVLVVASGTFLVLNINKWLGVKDEAEKAGVIILDNSLTRDNVSNFYYLDAGIEIGENVLVLKKMSLDNKSSVLYFDEDFDFSRYELSLKDNYKRSYYPDVSWAAGGEPAFPAGTVRFEPLKIGSKGFTLTCADKLTDESVTLDFLFSAPYALLPEKNVVNPILLKGKDGKTYGKISGASFSSTASTLYFSLYDAELADISLKEGSKPIPALRGEPLLFKFSDEDSVLGRMDFQPVSSLTGKVEFVFSGLFKPYPLRERVPVFDIVSNMDAENEITITLDNYDVVFERILKMGDTYVLVYHCSDTTVPVEDGADDNQYVDRTEVYIDATLVLTLPNGTQVSLQGESKSKRIGSDMIFDFSGSEYLTAIRQGRFQSLELSVKTVYISLGEVSVSIDLDAELSAKTSAGDYLSNYYLEANREKNGYAAKTVTYESLVGRNYRCVLAEAWLDDNEERKTAMREVTARIDENIVIIDSERIIPYR